MVTALALAASDHTELQAKAKDYTKYDSTSKNCLTCLLGDGKFCEMTGKVASKSSCLATDAIKTACVGGKFVTSFSQCKTYLTGDALVKNAYYNNDFKIYTRGPHKTKEEIKKEDKAKEAKTSKAVDKKELDKKVKKEKMILRRNCKNISLPFDKDLP